MKNGITSKGITWEILLKNKYHVLSVASENGNSSHTQKIRKKDIQALFKNSDNFARLIDLYADFELLSAKIAPIGSFNNIKNLSPQQMDQISTVNDQWLQLALMLNWGRNANENFTTVLRLCEIIRITNGDTLDFDDLFIPSKVSVQKMSLDPWLDLINYLLNGDKKDTYANFNAIHRGASFSVPKKIPNYKERPRLSFRPDDFNLSLMSLNKSAHRFLQLSRRSRKLNRKLSSLPLERLINALDFDIPGTLLVTDTIELLDSLKYVKLRSTDAGQFNKYNFGPPELNTFIGESWAAKIEKSNLSTRFSTFFTYSLESTVITDIGYNADQAAFIVHMLKKLGIEDTIKILETLKLETDGVTMRGFMELVRQGGFKGPEPAAWTAVLLPS